VRYERVGTRVGAKRTCVPLSQTPKKVYSCSSRARDSLSNSLKDIFFCLLIGLEGLSY
jgi:hypothetical protein